MLNFLMTPTWAALFNIFMISLIFLGIFLYVIYDLQDRSRPWAVRIATIIYAALQISLKVLLIIGIFDITANGMASGQWGLLIGYILVLLVDVSTIALYSLNRLERGFNVFEEMTDEEKQDLEDSINSKGSKRGQENL